MTAFAPLPSQANIVIIGAGPVGLAAVAHLIERSFRPTLLEAGTHIANNLHDFQHVKLFSPWRYNLDAAAVRLLQSQGWSQPDEDAVPTAGQIRTDYLLPLAEQLEPHIHLEHRVVAVGKTTVDKVKTSGRQDQPFVLRVETPRGLTEYQADAIIDASGTWQNPNPLGSNGLSAWGENEHQHCIAYGMPDILGSQRSRYTNRTTLVLGSGHSALGNLFNLVTLADTYPDTQLVWAVRNDGSPAQLKRIFGGGDKDQLAERGALGNRLQQLMDAGRITLHSHFYAHQVSTTAQNQIKLSSTDGQVIEPLDEIIVSTGARPNWQMHRELRLNIDRSLECTESLADLIDPNKHSCGTVPPHGYRELAHDEAHFYAVGAKSYGRAPSVLMATGYEQVRSIAAALAGDWSAADDVQLNLPQTGVCETDFAGMDATSCCHDNDQTQSNCCG